MTAGGGGGTEARVELAPEEALAAGWLEERRHVDVGHLV